LGFSHSNLPAHFRAFFAGIRTHLAMFCIVLAAFFCAFIARFRTELAYFFGMIAAETH
jgi:hypothetical protein